VLVKHTFVPPHLSFVAIAASVTLGSKETFAAPYAEVCNADFAVIGLIQFNGRFMWFTT
jgi:hypothetical protein